MFFNDLDGGTVLCRVAVNGHPRAIFTQKVHAEATPRETQGGKKQQDRFCDDRRFHHSFME